MVLIGSDAMSPEEIRDLTQTAIEKGASLLISTGKNAEAIHTFFDEIIVDLSLQGRLDLAKGTVVTIASKIKLPAIFDDVLCFWSETALFAVWRDPVRYRRLIGMMQEQT